LEIAVSHSACMPFIHVRGLRNAKGKRTNSKTNAPNAFHDTLFVWAVPSEGIQAEVLAQDAAEHGFMLIPGSLFFVNAPESPWMRFNMGWANDKRLFKYFAERLPVLHEMTASEFRHPMRKGHTAS